MLDDIQQYKEIFNSMPLGLFILDKSAHIIAWNAWMKTQTGFSQEDVIGKTLPELYPDHNFNRFLASIDQVLTIGSPQVISQILNKYLIPIPLVENTYGDIEYMQQHIDILPLSNEEGWLALVVVFDVTTNVNQKNVLMKLGRKFEQESYHDALTGIYNRRFLREWMEQQVSQARREEFVLACLMLDLDHFKKVNDTKGHAVGDQVLIQFADLLRGILRRSDLFARYGGEEFVVIVPRLSLEGVVELATRIRSLWEERSQLVLPEMTATCSIGIAMWQPDLGYMPQELLSLSDKALYAAKAAGRNCIRLYDPESQDFINPT